MFSRKRSISPIWLAALVLLPFQASAQNSQASDQVTFHKDIEPILRVAARIVTGLRALRPCRWLLTSR